MLVQLSATQPVTSSLFYNGYLEIGDYNICAAYLRVAMGLNKIGKTVFAH